MKHDVLACRECGICLMQVDRETFMPTVGMWAYVMLCPDCGNTQRECLSPKERMALKLRIASIEERMAESVCVTNTMQPTEGLWLSD